MKRLAVIPARGGSRRLPGKNVADFGGRPIIAWTVDAALETGRFDRIVVSTDDATVARAAAAAGAETVERPQALATDTATVVEVCLDLLCREREAGRNYEVLCCLYPTAPLRRAEDIVAVLDLLDSGVCDFAMATTRYAHPPHQALVTDADGRLRPLWPELVDRRAADLGELCVDNGSTYATKVAAFREHRTFYGPGLRGWCMPFSRSIDIDEREDLELARCLAGGALDH